MKNNWVSTIPLVFALSVALGFGFVEAQKDSPYFTPESLESLRVLNEKYAMAVDDLFEVESSPLVSDLLQADAFLSDQVSPTGNRGLLVTLDPNLSARSILLLQPLEPIADLELETLAREYDEAIPEFASVELDQEVELSSPVYRWHIQSRSNTLSSEAELAEESTPTIRIAVIDSGVDASHEVFTDDPVVTGWNTLTDDTTMEDDVGHGTHVAGIIASEAENIEIVPYKIVDANGGKLSNVIEAFAKALEDEVDIINMSFGVSSPSAALESLVDEAYSKNIVMVAAAGNNNVNDGFYPAEYEKTIAVASVDAAGEKMENSNYGNWVDIAAYGYHIRSSLPGNLYGYKSGTSQATAKVTAKVAALLLSPTSEQWTVEQILSGLQSQGTRILEGELAGVTRLE